MGLEGRGILDSEYADRGEWPFVAFGEGSRDSNENFRACWCGVEGTEFDCTEKLEL
jgi:hypothetical protein